MISIFVTPQAQKVTITIPEEYVGQPLELQVFPSVAEETVLPKKQVTFNAISIDTRNFKFNREEANER